MQEQNLPALMLALIVMISVLEYQQPFANAQDKFKLVFISTEYITEIEIIETWQSLDGGLIGGALSPDSSLVAIYQGEGIIELISTSEFEQFSTLQNASADGTYLTFNSDGTRVALTSPFSTMQQVWDTVSGEMLWSLVPTSEVVSTAINSNLSHSLILTSDGTLTVEQIDSGIQVSMQGIAELPNPVINNDGSQVFATSSDGEVILWDVIVNEVALILSPPLPFSEVSGYGFDQFDRYFWISWLEWLFDRQDNPGTIEFFEVTTQEEQVSISTDGLSFNTAAFSGDSIIVALAGQRDEIADGVWLVDLEQGQFVGNELATTGGGVMSFAPNGEFMAVASGTDPNVYFYGVPTMERLHQITLNNGTLIPPQISTDGTMILTQDFSTVSIWGVRK